VAVSAANWPSPCSEALYQSTRGLPHRLVKGARSCSKSLLPQCEMGNHRWFSNTSTTSYSKTQCVSISCTCGPDKAAEASCSLGEAASGKELALCEENRERSDVAQVLRSPLVSGSSDAEDCGAAQTAG
jgi:hypothetical protein